MRWAALCVIAGCAFHTHGVTGDGSVDAAIDARADAPTDTGQPIDCMAKWLDHTIDFDAAQPITSVNTVAYERDPYLSRDERTLYVSTIRTDSLPAGQTDVYMATRTQLTDSFGPLTKYAVASTTSGYETKMSVTADGSYLVVGSTQDGGAGGVDVWEATDTGSGFGALSRTHVMMVEDIGNQQDPMISSNGLHLYIAPDSSGRQILVVASRASTTANFGAPVAITELNDAIAGTADPTVSDDERVIVFSSSRTGTGAGDLWYATRSSAAATWSTPLQVPSLNTLANEGDPHLSSDGCRLYFDSDRNVTQSWDLFVANAR